MLELDRGGQIEVPQNREDKESRTRFYSESVMQLTDEAQRKRTVAMMIRSYSSDGDDELVTKASRNHLTS